MVRKNYLTFTKYLIEYVLFIDVEYRVNFAQYLKNININVFIKVNLIL